MRLAYAPYRLKFKSPATTSREVMTEKVTCFLKIYDESDPSRFGIGEAAVFPGLSPEANEGYEYKLVELLANIALGKPTDLSRHSSIQFGLEQAIRDYSAGCEGVYFHTDFVKGKSDITINGLVWMGSRDEMRRRAIDKLSQGFHCVKFKIGALDWDAELEMLKEIRSLSDTLEIRVDANGGLKHDIIMEQLSALADLNISSIEQPIPKGNAEYMAKLCRETPIPIALDEELIGIYTYEERERLLNAIHPQYIVLKPALCGGFSGAEEWIECARQLGIGWWITSALESNVGLNALAQWTAGFQPAMAQGLGTGALYLNNFEVPLTLDGEKLHYDNGQVFNHSQFNDLDWRE